MLRGIPVDREALESTPTLVVGAGLDRVVPESGSEQLAEWLSARYEPFGAHSHYGLVLGEHSHTQVADAVRAFVESHKL